MATVRPILDKVVVKVKKSNQSTGGGILLAGTSKNQTVTAKVIASGNGGMIDGRKVEMYVHEGDEVLIPKDAGTSFTLEGSEYIIVRQEEILAIVS